MEHDNRNGGSGRYVILNAADVRKAMGRSASYNSLGEKTWLSLATNYFNKHFPVIRSIQLWQKEDRRVTRTLYDNFMRALSMSELMLRTEKTLRHRRDGSILEPDELYFEIVSILDSIDKLPGAKLEMKLCAMHGTINRVQIKESPSPGLAEFSEAVMRLIGDPRWSVDIIYNLPTNDVRRWEQIKKRLQDCENAVSHQVKLYFITSASQVACPLLIGGIYALLAVSHKNYYMADYALMVPGGDGYGFVERYWNDLWEGAIRLRGPAGLDEKNVAAVDRMMAGERE